MSKRYSVFIELSKVAHSVNNIRNLPLHCVRQACRPISSPSRQRMCEKYNYFVGFLSP